VSRLPDLRVGAFAPDHLGERCDGVIVVGDVQIVVPEIFDQPPLLNGAVAAGQISFGARIDDDARETRQVVDLVERLAIAGRMVSRLSQPWRNVLAPAVPHSRCRHGAT